MIWINDNNELFKNPLYFGGRMVFNPSAELLIAAGYHQQQLPSVEGSTDPEPPVYRFSKYKIKQLLGEEGWAVKKAELEEADLWDDFILAECLATDDPLFSQYWADLGDEEKQLLIDNCQF